MKVLFAFALLITSDNKSITKLGGMGNKQETQGKAA